MNASPLRNLLSKHACLCRTSKSLQTSQNHTYLRCFSNDIRKQQAASPSISAYRAQESRSREKLKREAYKNTPPPKQLSHIERAKAFNRIRNSGLGILACAICMVGAVYVYSDQLPKKAKKATQSANVTSFDAPPSIAGVSPNTSTTEKVEQVPTGTTTIPTFPKMIHLPSHSSPTTPSSLVVGDQEYQLIGLGIRTVSFLGIQVYVVGLYIALPDIAILQEKLIRKVDPVATTLVAGEKAKLKEMLLDPELSEEIWNSVLKDGKMRTALRIVPTRNTDFMHLRDGWVRGITARTQHFSHKEDRSFSDETFGQAVNEFKAIWGGGARKNVPKGETLLLTRDAQGAMEAVYEDKTGSLRLGEIHDERVSRLIWLGYLGGKSVSSEGARQNIVEGCMDYVERPVGTVATQVV